MSAQAALYNGMLRLFRAFPGGGGAWGASWTPITKSGGGVSAAATLTAGTPITLYVLPVSIVKERMALPLVGIYTAAWWGLGATSLTIDPDTILVSVADGVTAFLVDGAADTSQGFPVFPLAKTQVPAGVLTTTDFAFLLENGDFLLLETGDELLLEA